MTNLAVYLSGEIHTDWRERIQSGVAATGLSVDFNSPVTDHDSSDDCGVVILGDEELPFWKDHKGAKLNAIETRTLIEKSDLVVVRLVTNIGSGIAFDAGVCSSGSWEASYRSS